MGRLALDDQMDGQILLDPSMPSLGLPGSSLKIDGNRLVVAKITQISSHWGKKTAKDRICTVFLSDIVHCLSV